MLCTDVFAFWGISGAFFRLSPHWHSNRRLQGLNPEPPPEHTACPTRALAPPRLVFLTEWSDGAAASPLHTGRAWTSRWRKPALSRAAPHPPTLHPLEVVGDRRMTTKLLSVMENISDPPPLQETVASEGSSSPERLLQLLPAVKLLTTTSRPVHRLTVIIKIITNNRKTPVPP